jgi:hypothetical protein
MVNGEKNAVSRISKLDVSANNKTAGLDRPFLILRSSLASWRLYYQSRLPVSAISNCSKLAKMLKRLM